MDSYTIYCAWCRNRGMPPPAREWWDRACAQPRKVETACDFDIETERWEGWGYADSH